MRALAKALKGSKGRRTRFHNERGEVLPLRGWLVLPRALLIRLTGRTADVPWLAPPAISFLAARIRPDWRAFEFGGGASTLWLARRCGSVTSLESDPAWHLRIRALLRASDLANCDLHLMPASDFPGAIRLAADASYDLVLVDGEETMLGDRLECLAAAAAKVKPGGYLVLDDSDRPAYRSADELLPGWKVHRFIGVRPSPLVAMETSVYRRTDGA